MEMMGVVMVVALLVVASSVGAAWGEEEREWGLVYRRCGVGAVKAKETEAVLERSVMGMDMVDVGGVRNDLHVVYYNNNNNKKRGMLWEAEVEMRGECEAGLDACGCLQCFAHAILQCPPSLSAHIRLHSCSISYSFPTAPGANSGGGGATRIAAIVVGAGVIVCLALLFVLFLRSRYSKRDYYY